MRYFYIFILTLILISCNEKKGYGSSTIEYGTERTDISVENVADSEKDNIVKLRSRSSPGPFLVHSRSILSHSNLFQFKIR